MPGTINQKEVARRAGVSVMTVSRTFSKRESVAPQTRQKVLAAARELGFTPNQLARDLRNGSSHTIGALMSLVHPFHDLHYMRHLSWKLLGCGYSCQLVDSMSDPELMIRALEDFLSRRVSMLILNARPNLLQEKNILDLLKSFPSLVLITRPGIEEIRELDFADKIIWNPSPALGEMISHLQRTGRNCGITTGRGSDGFLHQEAEKRNFKLLEAAVPDWRDDPCCEIRFIDENFPGKLPFDVIFSKVDETAHIMINYLRDRGLRVPEDVAVIGYNNTAIEGTSPIPIASIDWNLEVMTRCLEKMVMNRLEHPDAPPVTQTVNYRFILRRSCEGRETPDKKGK